MEPEVNNNENENNSPPPPPPRKIKQFSLNEELANKISSELNSRLSSLKQNGGSTAKPSKISEVQYEPSSKASPPLPPPRRKNELNEDVKEEIQNDDEMTDEINELENGIEDEYDENIQNEYDDEEKMNEDEPLDDIPESPSKNMEEKDDEVVDRRSSNQDISDKFESLMKENTFLMDKIKDLKNMLNEKEKKIKELNSLNKKLSYGLSELKDENTFVVNKLNKKVEILNSTVNELNEENEKLKKENLKLENEKIALMKKELDNTSESIKRKESTGSRPMPAIPPKPSRKACQDMIENAVAKIDEYDVEPIKRASISKSNNEENEEKKEVQSPITTTEEPVNETNEEKENKESGSTFELLPSTTSKPLVLPTKNCVRKRNHHRTSNTSSRHSSTRKANNITNSNIVDEPIGNSTDDMSISSPSITSMDKQNAESVTSSPVVTSAKMSSTTTKEEKAPTSDHPPPLPQRVQRSPSILSKSSQPQSPSLPTALPERNNTISSETHAQDQYQDEEILESNQQQQQQDTPPPVPKRSSERKEKAILADSNEIKNKLANMKKSSSVQRTDSPIPSEFIDNQLIHPSTQKSYIYEVSTIESEGNINKTSSDKLATKDNAVAVDEDKLEKPKAKIEKVENDGDGDTSSVKQEEKNEEEKNEEEKNEDEDESTKEEPEVNPTLSRIHKIGRGLPSLLPEGGLSNIKLRSTRIRHGGSEDSNLHSARQFGQIDELNEEDLLKWIFSTVACDPVDGNLFTVLHDGTLLCKLINAVRKGSQITPKAGRMRAWHIVNINAYLSGCVDIHLKTLFKAEDLYEEENLDVIMKNLNELRYYFITKK